MTVSDRVMVGAGSAAYAWLGVRDSDTIVVSSIANVLVLMTSFRSFFYCAVFDTLTHDYTA